MGGDGLNIWPLLEKIFTYFYSDAVRAAMLINEK